MKCTIVVGYLLAFRWYDNFKQYISTRYAITTVNTIIPYSMK